MALRKPFRRTSIDEQYRPRGGIGMRLMHDRMRAVTLAVAIAFVIVAGQLVRLGLQDPPQVRLATAETIVPTVARPDIFDRRGLLLATEVTAPSLYADPSVLLDVDEAIEKLRRILPGMDDDETRRALSDRSRRFVWLKRGMTPQSAQAAHDLGLPGLAFRSEPKRIYPAAALAGHVIGSVNADNRGMSGIERHIDAAREDARSGSASPTSAPVRLSIDSGVQHALQSELAAAIERYAATSAVGMVMDVDTGEMVAATSLPEVDPNRPTEALRLDHLDKLTQGVFELGSIWKILTVALALEAETATLASEYDVSEPIKIGSYTISDLHAQRRRLSVRDIFVHSSNIGAGLMALDVGTEKQRAFISKLGLADPMRTELGPLATPLLPQTWGKIETVTVAYGHGLALAPMQYAAAVASLVNGGYRVTPTFLARDHKWTTTREKIVATSTSDAIREILRLNVTLPYGTGRRAEVEGYRLGGKTGTAEMPGIGGYLRKSVIASFLAVMPMDQPRYLTLVMLFEPKGDSTGGHITAGVNAAPTTAKLVARIAPMLGLLPRRLEAKGGIPKEWFDAILEQN
jgi:cell division protein FtsI (penicillin-binding protein 3)